MTLQEFNFYIDNEDKLDASSLLKIEEAEKKYPYFQTLKLLKLKNLASVRSLRLSEELSDNIVYFTDRKHLLTQINNEEFLWLKLLKKDIKGKENLQKINDSFSLIELYLTSINNSDLSDRLPYEKENPKENNEDVFQDFLKEIEEKPDNKDLQETEDSQLQLINNFLNSEHENLVKSVIPEQTLNYKADISTDNEIKEEAFLTESLAKIYIKQKKYGKALEIIKKLSLKYPEKNVYFADQIRFLEIIISNIKTK